MYLKNKKKTPTTTNKQKWQSISMLLAGRTHSVLWTPLVFAWLRTCVRAFGRSMMTHFCSLLTTKNIGTPWSFNRHSLNCPNELFRERSQLTFCFRRLLLFRFRRVATNLIGALPPPTVLEWNGVTTRPLSKIKREKGEQRSTKFLLVPTNNALYAISFSLWFNINFKLKQFFFVCLFFFYFRVVSLR